MRTTLTAFSILLTSQLALGQDLILLDKTQGNWKAINSLSDLPPNQVSRVLRIRLGEAPDDPEDPEPDLLTKIKQANQRWLDTDQRRAAILRLFEVIKRLNLDDPSGAVKTALDQLIRNTDDAGIKGWRLQVEGVTRWTKEAVNAVVDSFAGSAVADMSDAQISAAAGEWWKIILQIILALIEEWLNRDNVSAYRPPEYDVSDLGTKLASLRFQGVRERETVPQVAAGFMRFCCYGK